MFNNAFLDIAIGLVLMYLVLSLMGTVINEFIATAISLRATTLQAAIERLLDNPELRAAFYDHGLIDSAKQATGGNHTSYISGQTFALAIIGSIDPNNPLPGFAQAQAAVQNLPTSNIKDVLLAELTKANGSLDKFRGGIATYFDGTMDRVSGTYERYLKYITLAVGFVIVIVLNADTVAVGTALWKDSSLRAQMVETAQGVLTTEKQNAMGTGKTNDFPKRLTDLDNDIRPLPIGWTSRDFQTPPSWELLRFWLAKFLGLIITAFAISLGAPFWFDMLSKIMNIRGAGPKPDSTTATAAPTTSTAHAGATPA